MMDRKPFGRRLYEGWLVIAGRFAHVQTLVILSFFYAFMMGPFASAIALGRGDLLAKRGLRAPGSAWREAETTAPEIERARQQF